MPLSSLNVSSSDRSLSLLIAPYRSLHPESGVGKQESGITGCMVSDTVDDITPSNRALPGLLRLSAAFGSGTAPASKRAIEVVAILFSIPALPILRAPKRKTALATDEHG